MASVVTLELIKDVPQGEDYRKIQYKFTLLDNLNVNHFVIYPPKVVPNDFDHDAEMLEIAPTLLTDKEFEEQGALQARAREGEIVLHDDMGGWYEKKTLAWGTWDDQTKSWLIFWLSQEDKLELVNMKPDLDLISNTDLKNLLLISQGDTTDIRGDVQTAIDTKTSLDAYAPYYDEDGNWVHS